MFGSSVIPVDDATVPLVLNRLSDCLGNAGVKNFPPPSLWKPTKADIYTDFHVGNEVGNYVDALRQRTIPKYKTGNYGSQTVFWTCGSRDIKMYDRHACCIDGGKDPATTHFSQGVLRLEVQVKASDIRKCTGNDQLGDFYNSVVINKMLNNYLEKIGRDNLRITTEREISEIIQSHFSPEKAMRMVGYLRARQQGFDPELHRTTIYRYKKDIKKLGIVPVIGIRRLTPLVITSDFSTAEKLAQYREYNTNWRIVN